MGKVYDAVDEPLRRWIERQHVFFVATAPLDADGHVNVSPKGLDSFRVLDGRTAAYLDLTGSGIETVAHLRDNGRICVMFCAFAGPPRIVRLHGRGSVTERGEPGFDAAAAVFAHRRSARSVITVAVDRISDSCGYAVPLMAYERDRDRLDQWSDARDDAALEEYRAEKNAASIDGLPGLARP